MAHCRLCHAASRPVLPSGLLLVFSAAAVSPKPVTLRDMQLIWSDSREGAVWLNFSTASQAKKARKQRKQPLEGKGPEPAPTSIPEAEPSEALETVDQQDLEELSCAISQSLYRLEQPCTSAAAAGRTGKASATVTAPHNHPAKAGIKQPPSQLSDAWHAKAEPSTPQHPASAPPAVPSAQGSSASHAGMPSPAAESKAPMPGQPEQADAAAPQASGHALQDGWTTLQPRRATRAGRTAPVRPSGAQPPPVQPAGPAKALPQPPSPPSTNAAAPAAASAAAAPQQDRAAPGSVQAALPGPAHAPSQRGPSPVHTPFPQSTVAARPDPASVPASWPPSAPAELPARPLKQPESSAPRPCARPKPARLAGHQPITPPAQPPKKPRQLAQAASTAHAPPAAVPRPEATMAMPAAQPVSAPAELPAQPQHPPPRPASSAPPPSAAVLRLQPTTLPVSQPSAPPAEPSVPVRHPARSGSVPSKYEPPLRPSTSTWPGDLVGLEQHRRFRHVQEHHAFLPTACEGLSHQPAACSMVANGARTHPVKLGLRLLGTRHAAASIKGSTTAGMPPPERPQAPEEPTLVTGAASQPPPALPLDFALQQLQLSCQSGSSPNLHHPIVSARTAPPQKENWPHQHGAPGSKASVHQALGLRVRPQPQTGELCPKPPSKP